MNPYLQRALANLGPKSVEKTNPAVMLREWRATGRVEDLGDIVGTCGVCSKEELRYLFEIKNVKTSATADSGSSCILKFEEIGVVLGGTVVYGLEEKYEALSAALERLKKANLKTQRLDAVRRVKASLEAIPSSQHRLNDQGESIFLGITESVRDYLERDEKMFPSQFALFIWAAQVANEALPFGSFRGFVNLRGRGVAQAQKLRREQGWRYRILKRALTPEQIRKVES